MSFATVSAQDYSDYLNAAKKHLQNGNIEKAEAVYNVYKQLTKKKDSNIESLLLNRINAENKDLKLNKIYEKANLAMFDEIDDSHLLYRRVRKGEKWGMINYDNNIVIPIKYDVVNRVSNEDVENGFTAVLCEIGNMTGFVSIDGTELTEFKYEGIRGYEDQVPNPYYIAYLNHPNEVYVDMKGVEYLTEDEAAYGIKGLKENTTLTKGPYKVGDFYNESNIKGVVFEVDETGTHGKIMGIQQKYQEFAIEKDCEYTHKHIGSFDKFDGENNMHKIHQIQHWKYKFPIYSWCSHLGVGWYLPAIYELKSIYDNKECVNRGLKEAGRRPLEVYARFASSTEIQSDTDNIYYLFFGPEYGEEGNDSKNRSYQIVAIKKF